MVLDIIAITAVMVVVFILVRSFFLTRDGKRRDGSILELLAPIALPLARGETVEAEDVRRVAEPAFLRPMLYEKLSQYDATELFPTEWLTADEQAKALLAYWVTHPNELQEAPIEVVADSVVQRRVDGKNADFRVMRMRMPEGHWVGRDWLLGVTGPFFGDDEPFADHLRSFSRAGDKAGNTDVGELIDWFLGMVKSRK